jgi:type 1 glutamine amidotransferase
LDHPARHGNVEEVTAMNYLKLLILSVCSCAASLPVPVFADDAAPLRIHMIGIGEYKPVESLTAFKQYLQERYRVAITTSFSNESAGRYKDGTTLPDLEKLRDADVMVVFARRINLPEAHMAIVRNHWEQGKAIVAMRTASHAFQPADNEIFDRQVLGGHYGGAADYKTPFNAIPAEGQAEHAVLSGVGPITSRGYYGNRPLAADAIVIQVNDEPQRKVKRPVPWLPEYRGGRTFYTSMGVPEDFQDEDFRRLLTNAIFWTARRDVPKVKPK